MAKLIRKIACALCQALGGHPIEQPLDIGNIVDSSPRIDKQTPSIAYLAGKMPTYNIDDLVKHLKYRISIHETYWGLVEDDPVSWSAFGNSEFHEWAIEGYQNAILYLKRLG